MRKTAWLLFLALALAGAGAAGLAVWPIGKDEQLSEQKGDAARGAYLARMSGCIACHTDTSSGGAPLAGGVRLSTEFGSFYSPNLTTDPVHGLGNWTIAQFAKAVRQGVSPDGKPYYPAFPYPFYAWMSDQDIADLWAAFQTVPPVSKASMEQDLGFPFSFRPGLKLWRALFLDNNTDYRQPDRSDLWNRGKFIVEGPAHCGACHTPRNLAGARQAEFNMHGADKLPDGGKSPPITTQALVDKGWTAADLKYALKTGILPDGDAFGGLMGEVVRDGTQFLADRDLEAIAAYLLNKDEIDD